VLEAVPFPIHIQFPSLVGEAGAGLGPADVLSIGASADDPEALAFAEIGEAFAEALLRLTEAWKKGEVETAAATPEERALFEALAALPTARSGVFINRDIGPLLQAVLGSMQMDLDKRGPSVDVKWIKLDVTERPTLTLGNPVSLAHIVVHVQARIEACIKVLGKKFCASATSPRVRIEGREALIDLTNRGALVNGTPRFKDVDIVIRIKLWKWTYDIRVGVTGRINDQLRKAGPIKLIDLSAMEQNVPYSSSKIQIESIAVAPDPRGLLASVTTRIR
jgi:hypothetical protein